MPRSPLEGRRIVVEHRGDDCCFAGNVPVILPTRELWLQNLRGPWKLAKETAIGLGLDWGADRSVRLHSCPVCRNLFIAYYSTHLCSEACVKASRKAWHEAHRRPPSPPSKAAQRRDALASARCEVCGDPFKPHRLSARFCSNRCRQKHHRSARAAHPPALFPPGARGPSGYLARG
jgi:hypothetical protein